MIVSNATLTSSLGYGFMQIPRNQKESDMTAPIYPIAPLRQIAIILAHCVLRIQNKLTLRSTENYGSRSTASS